ncbi:pyridoxal phosphate-dependent aminotransferase [Aestuariirhabdus sp. Z084]|uniref:pyridoxal phosphate-dependent aminotransferase n=1 Tax=Aestuariirhabdus haliotis TaxID=2918751 RepID=UPI00201B353C|nr:pyridoxal phosphate-dependent aminotransferase [Aestuariirhabdus haliotis]MCL6415465.1 pyridoxal phosphate-dependent aminotransferase [Aestuariirhabdus haliotis]MCL6419330.1 pyridoxal phosphate-dependent aminotransferase [Aestuariirhabdus haliotis]
MDPLQSQRVLAIKPSPTLAVTSRAAELKAQGKQIIGLGAGEPDFDTPDHIKQAAIQAIHDGKTKYTAVDGTAELKQAVIDKFSRDNQLGYLASQILISSGGKQSFFNLSLALLNTGDEVIIPAPYWVSYPDMVRIADATPVIISANQQQGFKITAEQLAEAITPRTRLFVLNSPSNPTGAAYTRQELSELAEVLIKHPRIVIASDDMYEHILWGREPFCNLLNVCPALYDRTIVLNGVSKAYSMTGWRIGYAAGPERLIKGMKKVQSQSTSNPCSIAQAAATEALNGPQDCVQEMLKAFKSRHDFVLSRLNLIEGVYSVPSSGTFYSFPSFHEVLKVRGGNDVELAEYLLNTAGVALVPGSAFGSEGYMRLSFATSRESLAEALDRIEKALS